MNHKPTFSSRIGLIAATVGSAVGLGNIWRFPAETQANGGAAFLIVYIACVLLLGIPVMIAEFSLGRAGRTDVVSVFRKFTPPAAKKRPWWLGGATALSASYIILSFYMVVAAWTLLYFWQSLSGELFTGVDLSSTHAAAISFQTKMQQSIGSDSAPVAATLVMIAINFLILLLGVQKGIERASNIMMPILFLLLLIFAVVSLSLPKAGDGLKFFLSPDFSQITPSVIISALGQAFFSLSLGMGILITYAAYYPPHTKLIPTAATVASLDLLVAILMGIIIFPAVISLSPDPSQLKGTTLVFATLPQVFLSMPGSQFWAALFFLLLLVAALTSTISISEVSVSFLQDRFHLSRRRASFTVMAPLLILSPICAMSFGLLSDVHIAGLSIFDFLDNLATNILLPLASIITCLFIGWQTPASLLRSEIHSGHKQNGSIASSLYPLLIFIIRYVAPLLIFIIWLSAFITL